MHSQNCKALSVYLLQLYCSETDITFVPIYLPHPVCRRKSKLPWSWSVFDKLISTKVGTAGYRIAPTHAREISYFLAINVRKYGMTYIKVNPNGVRLGKVVAYWMFVLVGPISAHAWRENCNTYNFLKLNTLPFE